ncbi:MAG: D-aminoacyl-tRNA deacylase [Chitinispirillaceae bacterium]|jgi:D-aminoacyl-tRNA deacylase
MKIILQRVKSASVKIDGSAISAINRGILILLGVHKDDTAEKADFLAAKCANLRIFPDEQGKMNRSLKEIDGEALVVSQFTLFGDCSRGRRPSFIDAAPPDKGRELYEHFIDCMKQQVRIVATGVFGAMMEVELVNDGPVTLILER